MEKDLVHWNRVSSFIVSAIDKGENGTKKIWCKHPGAENLGVVDEIGTDENGQFVNKATRNGGREIAGLIECYTIPDYIPVEEGTWVEKGFAVYGDESNTDTLSISSKNKSIELIKDNGTFRKMTKNEENEIWGRENMSGKVEVLSPEEERAREIEWREYKIKELRKMTKGIKEGMDKSTPIKEVDAGAPFNVVAKKLEKGGR